MIELPPLRPPAGSYVGRVRVGDLLFLSGQGADGHVGRVGETVTPEQGYQAARACALNLLAQVDDAVGLSAVRQIVQVRGYVACTSSFVAIPEVIDGASDLLVSVFGDRGRHARTALGVASLPRGFSVEVDMIVQVDS